ncbi:Histone-lysine N-methyltransferase SETMAR [Melipona quadrifasciata]|uniref:Histone-lysine N-methyltransferase SETMAR n=1 Tax=Melipona quadrifasciata TaxID=166423 RepID=A0A0M8ZZF2_9HYME|nr:Histone-lysine N-methyltransferase SETMAR [Melipona quadrifasciata]
MESQKMHLWHVMLRCFKKGNSAKDAADEIFTVYGSGTTTIRTVRDWFKKFRAGNFEFKDENCSGRPATTDTDIIKTVLTENPRYSVREIVNATNIPKTTVHKHRYEVWVPHLLTETGLMNRFHHDNARPHVSRKAWDVLPHPPYSPDLAPSDYYLFLSLKNSLRGKSFKSIGEIKTHLDEYRFEEDNIKMNILEGTVY